jgi:hypothetical protein
MDEKIRATIEKIVALSKQNEEFNLEMRKLFGKTVSASTVSDNQAISDDIAAIRAALEIRGNHSIDYGFIKEQRLKEQLFIDNLRMENAALNLKEKESDRFYTFCVNAFYQVENIVNYYFHKSYPEINDLLTAIENATKNDSDGKKSFRFKRAKGEKSEYVEKNVSDIDMFYKMNALCNIMFPNDKAIKSTLSNLRKVRNEGEHRCQIIWEEKNEENKLYVFLKKATFNSIRITLKKVVSEVKANLQSLEKSDGTNESEYKATILQLINKLEAIKKAYDEGDYDSCENLIDVGQSILASLNVDDKNTRLIQSQLNKWSEVFH